jgi:hypothetical protein
VSEIAPATEADKEISQYLHDVTERARQGDQTALPSLRLLLQDPAAVDYLGGDLAREAQRMLIDRYSGTDLLLKEALSRKLELLRAELAGPTPAPLERLLAERVVTCWLYLHQLEVTCAQRDSMALELGACYQKCIDRAHQRYLSGIKMLALVRKLTVPVIIGQVNVGGRQVNKVTMAAATGAGAREEPDGRGGGGTSQDGS